MLQTHSARSDLVAKKKLGLSPIYKWISKKKLFHPHRNKRFKFTRLKALLVWQYTLLLLFFSKVCLFFCNQKKIKEWSSSYTLKDRRIKWKIKDIHPHYLIISYLLNRSLIKRKSNAMGDEEVLFDDIYQLCEIIGKWVIRVAFITFLCMSFNHLWRTQAYEKSISPGKETFREICSKIFNEKKFPFGLGAH